MKLKTFVLICACSGAFTAVRGQGSPVPACVTNQTVEFSMARTNDSAVITDDCAGQVFPEKPQSPGRAVPEGKESSVHPQTEAKNLVTCSADGEFYAFATPDGRLKYCRARDGVVLHTF